VAGLGAQEVGRPQDPLLLVEVGIDVAVAIGVVAQRDHVHAQGEDLARVARRDPDAARRVLAVDHHERGVVTFAQGGQQRGERPPPDTADHVADEQDARRGRHGLGVRHRGARACRAGPAPHAPALARTLRAGA